MSTSNDATAKSQGPFSNPAMVASYADEAPRKVPGLADLHRMAMLLLSERAQQAAHILVVGAGGGMELKAMAEAQREWVFTGIDPSAAMSLAGLNVTCLPQARHGPPEYGRVGAHASRQNLGRHRLFDLPQVQQHVQNVGQSSVPIHLLTLK